MSILMNLLEVQKTVRPTYSTVISIGGRVCLHWKNGMIPGKTVIDFLLLIVDCLTQRMSASLVVHSPYLICASLEVGSSSAWIDFTIQSWSHSTFAATRRKSCSINRWGSISSRNRRCGLSRKINGLLAAIISWTAPLPLKIQSYRQLTVVDLPERRRNRA